ncbi:LacI family DNA-binding transcriptional regulator [uncultured Pseudokineococcus sp.]|uniref:LacI family DNA-binding transcriptional regulator n=1 Tax=uncultured Pseudokineococcus sp. TaxID=1642928 RepID=UPI002629D0D3|nr:LacI family DNA-binding transcriptional regulator [uncultured Pseudokineococcus sp.]
MTTDSARPTLAAIAADVGVSVATVSKVLNGRSDVALSTRARVEETIERLSYQRRPSRTTGGPRLLELVFHELSTWGEEIIRGVESVAGPERVALVLTELGGVHRPPQEWLDDCLARRPMGVVFVLSEVSPDQRRQLRARSIPFVVVDTAGEPPPEVPTVGSTNWNGALAATRHLIELGHRRLAVVTGPADVLCSRARLDGCRTGLAEAGLDLDPSLVRYGNFHVEGGYTHGSQLLSRPDRPTAVFAGSDYQALGVLRAARELGLRVPEDVSVVGYDDLPVARWIGPALTTVRQPLQEMAGTATRMVLDLARGERLATPRIDLATELVVRESTAPPSPVHR